MYSSTTQKHNQLNNGDLVGGNKFENNSYYLPQENKDLIRLYEQFRIEQSNQTTCTSFSAKLQHYLTEITDSEVRGLDLKLKESGREDMIFFAQGKGSCNKANHAISNVTFRSKNIYDNTR